MLYLSILATAIIVAPAFVNGLAKLEPADGKIIFGPWYDSSTGPVSGGETANGWNQKIGFNSGVFQFYQHLPPKAPVNGPPDFDTGNHNPDGTLNISILNDGTDAAIFFTIYPESSVGILDLDILALANQCQFILTSTGRNMFLRFAPEMNGNWMGYSGNPTAFITLWKRVYAAINKAAPAVAIVWSPNPDTAQGLFPYAPYWPGPEYVDWVGQSLYWKGYQDDYPLSYMMNTPCPTDFTEQAMDAAGLQGSSISFYQEYAQRYDKPFVISEGAGAFQLKYSINGAFTQIDPAMGRAATVMGFWNSNLFNPSFLKKYPKFKMALAFEIWKVENEQQYTVERDYRITGNAETIAAFTAGLQKLDSEGRMIWANAVQANNIRPIAILSIPITMTATGTLSTPVSPGIGVLVATQPVKDFNPSPKASYSLQNICSPLMFLSAFAAIL